MKIDGGCHCGAIAYEAEIDPDMVSICHCTDCQTLSGTAFRVVIFASEENFRLTRGTPKAYVKTAESGNRRVQAFCAECGSPIYATSADVGPKSYGIRVGTARQRADLKPRRQIWHRSAAPWLPGIEGLATKEMG
ncbi:MAG: GFA family protein [Mesorhizobium sp.]|nr:GFA family protein [Mesorhizobium sp.]